MRKWDDKDEKNRKREEKVWESKETEVESWEKEEEWNWDGIEGNWCWGEEI